LCEHINNFANAGYLNKAEEIILRDNIETLNAKMLEFDSTYENGIPLDVETDTIDRLFKETLSQTKPESENPPVKPSRTPDAQKDRKSAAKASDKPSILSQVEDYKKIISQGNKKPENTPKRDKNQEV
jgi:hypothetical protein